MIISLFTRNFLTTDLNFINKVYENSRIISTKTLHDNHIDIDTVSYLGGFDRLADYILKDNSYSYNFIVCRGIKEFKKILCCYFKLMNIEPYECFDYLKAYIDHSNTWKEVCYRVMKLNREDIKEKETREFFLHSVFDMYSSDKYQNSITDSLFQIPESSLLLKELPIEYIGIYKDNKNYPNLDDIANKKLTAFLIYSILGIKNEVLRIQFQNAIPINKNMILTKEQLEGYIDEKDYYVEHKEELCNLISSLLYIINSMISENDNSNKLDLNILERLKYLSELFNLICYRNESSKYLLLLYEKNKTYTKIASIFDFGYSGINIFKINKHILKLNCQSNHELKVIKNE